MLSSTYIKMKTIVVLGALVAAVVAHYPCVQRQMQYGTVCVCNSTYCDTVADFEKLSSGEFQLYSTNKGNLGFHSTIGKFLNQGSSSANKIDVPDFNAKLQKIMGFGGAFTGATAYVILTLPKAAQDKLLESYFAEDGIRYTIQRVVMGASDLSVSAFTNCEKKDETLDSWKLMDEDDWRIDVINRAAKLRGKDDLKLFISSWSSPLWMKTIEDYFGSGVLKPEYYDLWAEYYLKFLRAYREKGVEFWGVTTQNEAFTSPTTNINLKFTFETMNEWLVGHFGPKIRNSEFKDIQIMILDDDTYLLPTFKPVTFQNETVMKYTDGIAIHWYSDNGNVESYWEGFPEDKFILATEACQNVQNYLSEMKVELGNWQRGVDYINTIIYDLEHKFNGWVEWNLALNLTGGPSWMHASLDAPIIVNATAGEFYKEPMFYVLGHFSKFVVPDSYKLDHTINKDATTKGISTAAFVNPKNEIVVVLSNAATEVVSVDLTLEKNTHTLDLPANSINTLIYKP